MALTGLFFFFFLSGKGLFSYQENQENAYARIILDQIERSISVGQRTAQRRHLMWFNPTLTFPLPGKAGWWNTERGMPDANN